MFGGGGHGVPCLLVDDVDRAVEYYRDVLDFPHARILEGPTPAALLRRGSSRVLVQRAPDASGGLSHRRFGGLQWDALFFVDDVAEVSEALRARGARIQVGVGITAVSDRTLEVRDEWGNVLAFAESRSGVRPRIRSAVGAVLPESLPRSVRQRRRRAEEAPERRRIHQFIASLRVRDPFYMFFTQGLLHWVRAAERLVPTEVDLVLIGSALPPEEEEWLRANIGRPLHVIRLGVDDNTVWDFLFDCNQGNFGYLDIDCFVLNPELFTEMAAIGPDVAVNGIWTYDADGGRPIACTHFAFINAGVIEEMRRRDAYLSPANYDWEGATISLLHPRDYCRVPTARQREQLLKVLPRDDRGRPTPPGDSPFFDTLVAYQVAAYGAGFRTARVRRLQHRTQATLDPDAPTWQQDVSDEVVHVGGVSYYQRWFHSPSLRGMYLAAEHALIRPAVHSLPPGYAGRLRALSGELVHLGLVPEATGELVRTHLVRDRGLRPETATRIVPEDDGVER